MSKLSAQPPVLGKTELETVVCWPLIYSAAGLVLLALTTFAGLAVRSALNKAPSQEQAAVRPSVAPAPPARLTVEFGDPSAEPAPVAKAPVSVAPSVAPAPAPTLVRFYEDDPAAAKRPARVAAPAPRSAPVRVARAGKAPGSTPPHYRQRNYLSEEELLALLAKVPELDLEKEKGTTAKLLAKAPKDRKAALTHPVLDVLAARADLRGLPVRDVRDCVAGDARARTLEAMSRHVRRLQGTRALEQQRIRAREAKRGASASASDIYGDALRQEVDYEFLRSLKSRTPWKDEKAVGPLMQMLQADTPPIRLELVQMLASIEGRAATDALARLAVFDLSAAVRRDAIAVLAKRSLADARPVFLKALRYPWAPVARHAAEALVSLDDRKAIPALEPLLELPDPSAPTLTKDKKLVVTELVRVNHLRNCALCHAPSADRAARARGLVPTPGKAIPVVYYESMRGDFVRADVTYLQQDFSALMRVAKAAPWPEMQRYDYLLRTRELSSPERAAWAATIRPAERPAPGKSAVYPQKEAVLFALESLKKKLPPEPD
jgi:hypothetical protein